MKTRFLLTMIFCAAISIAYAQDVLSSKQNIPVKKETFASKLERYKSEGFKVAVILGVGSLKTKTPPPPSSSAMSNSLGPIQIVLEGEIALDDSDFKSFAEQYAAKMNEAFATDVFEVVDVSNIPSKESKWGTTYEWWTTKYKMVAGYSITPIYDFSSSSDVASSNSKKKAEFTVSQSALVYEYIYDKKKGFKLKYPVRVGGLGSYSMSYSEEGALEGLKTVEELHAIVNPPMGADLAAELQKAFDEKMPEYIAKRKK